jgi:putative peptide maturation system protein
MTTTTVDLRSAMSETLEYLMALAREGTRPDEAQTYLVPLRQRFPQTALELVWEEQGYDASVHYDALLRVSDLGTVSLGFAPDRAVPWPLRGAHRWTEKMLLRVNQQVLNMDQAIACLDFIWDDRGVIDRLVNVCLIQEALAQDPIDLSDDELQEAMDGFRRAHRLYTAEQTVAWMTRRGMTHEQLERYVADEAIVAKLRERVTASEVDSYLAAHLADFDAARIARIDFADEAAAHRAAAQIRAGEHDFFATAARRFLDQLEPAPEFALLQRVGAPPDWEAVFAAAPGDTLGPLPAGNGYAVVRVLAVAPAEAGERTRRAVERVLFERWLANRRDAATIEWNWGNADLTRTEEEGEVERG